MKRDEITHTGRVESIDPAWTTVSFVSHAACASCHAAGLCGMTDRAEKSIQLPTDPYAAYAPGDEVQIVFRATMGLKAVWLAYMVPLLILMALVLLLSQLGVRDWAAGLGGIGGVGLYYLILWCLRGRLRKEYVFEIRKI